MEVNKIATTIRKHAFKSGETLRLKKLSNGKYSLTVNGSRLEDPIKGYKQAKQEYTTSIRQIKKGSEMRRKEKTRKKDSLGLSQYRIGGIKEISSGGGLGFKSPKTSMSKSTGDTSLMGAWEQISPEDKRKAKKAASKAVKGVKSYFSKKKKGKGAYAKRMKEKYGL